MKNSSFFLRLVVSLMGTTILFYSSGTLATNILATNSVEWRQQMRVYKATLGELLPLTVNAEAFNAAENALPIQKAILQLSEASHVLNHKDLPKEADPTIVYVASAFEDNLLTALENLKKGRRDYARYLVLNTLSYCIECHTRTKEQPEFFEPMPGESLLKLNQIEQVEYLLATRKFTEALSSIETFFTNGKLDQLTLGSEKLARYGLMISVRYNQDPKRALSLIDTIIGGKNIPYFIKRDAAHWRASALAWQKEPKMKSPKASEVLDLAQSLITKGADVNTKENSLHAGDIYFLRANSLLIQLLKEKLSKEQVSKALLLIGESYEDRTEDLFWSIHRHYYEACVRNWPHSELAGKCFKKYESSTQFAFSGSAGYFLPPKIKTKLIQLRDLSRPAKKSIRK